MGGGEEGRVCGEVEARIFDCRGDSAAAQVRGVFGEDNEFGHGDDGIVGLGGDEVFPALGGLWKKYNISSQALGGGKAPERVRIDIP